MYIYVYTYIWCHCWRRASCGCSSLTIQQLSREYQHLNVPCSYTLTAMVKFALLEYLSEFRLRVSSFRL